MLARDVVSSLRAPPVQRHRMVRGKPLRPSTQSETRPCRRPLSGPVPRWMRKGRVGAGPTPTGKRRRGRCSTGGRGGTSISCFSRQGPENTEVHETARCASILAEPEQTLFSFSPREKVAERKRGRMRGSTTVVGSRPATHLIREPLIRPAGTFSVGRLRRPLASPLGEKEDVMGGPECSGRQRRATLRTTHYRPSTTRKPITAPITTKAAPPARSNHLSVAAFTPLRARDAAAP